MGDIINGQPLALFRIQNFGIVRIVKKWNKKNVFLTMFNRSCVAFQEPNSSIMHESGHGHEGHPAEQGHEESNNSMKFCWI